DAVLDAIHDHWRQGFDAGVERGLSLKPGALDLLQLPQIQRVLVTSSGREGAHHKLRIAGIAEAFAHVVTYHDVNAPKPAPEPYLVAAQLLRGAPGPGLVFEGSESAAESAYLAGRTVVQGPHVVPSEGQWPRHWAPHLFTGAQMAG